ncbi:MAG: serine O-acetyltransferase [Magnetococcales bacterium]|nr:serine O-acetyltransferase [Magnetococcales bacterium]
MFARIRNDIRVVFARDPAARHVLEVLLCYPGVHAMLAYRLAHWLWTHHLKLAARMVSYLGRMLTGIEIHPGARIGQGFFIDHGMGVVIGETTEIGDNVTIYHGVTLGGTTWQKGKRHPTLEENVIVGAGAKILGPVTIGSNARVGSNAVVVNNVPRNTTVVGIPGRVIVSSRGAKEKADALFPAYGQMESMPDPVVRAITCVLEQMHHLDDRIQTLEEMKENTAHALEKHNDFPEGKMKKSPAGTPAKGGVPDCLQGVARSNQATPAKGEMPDCLQGVARPNPAQPGEMQGGCGP